MEAKPFPTDIKAVVIDVDGTLLNDDHELSERNRETLRKAMDAGIKVLLATGKTRAGAASVIAALQLDTPGVYSQGLMIYNGDGTVRHQTTLNVQAARRAIQYAESNGYDVIVYSGNRLLVRDKDNLMADITKFHEPQPESVGNLVNILGREPIHKLLILGKTTKKVKALRWQLNQQVGQDVNFTESAMLISLEVLPKGASKGNGVKMVLKELGILPSDAMAIGDAENDIEMLQLVGLPVAIGNASDKVKAVAKEIVASNNEDGVAQAIEKFVLKQEEAPVVEEAADESETPAETAATVAGDGDASVSDDAEESDA